MTQESQSPTPEIEAKRKELENEMVILINLRLERRASGTESQSFIFDGKRLPLEYIRETELNHFNLGIELSQRKIEKDYISREKVQKVLDNLKSADIINNYDLKSSRLDAIKKLLRRELLDEDEEKK